MGQCAVICGKVQWRTEFAQSVVEVALCNVLAGNTPVNFKCRGNGRKWKMWRRRGNFQAPRIFALLPHIYYDFFYILFKL